MSQGAKYLAKQLDEQATKLGGQIRTLKADNELLSISRTKQQQVILSMASGKFWPCFKKFLEQRRICKKEKDEKATV